MSMSDHVSDGILRDWLLKSHNPCFGAHLLTDSCLVCWFWFYCKHTILVIFNLNLNFISMFLVSCAHAELLTLCQSLTENYSEQTVCPTLSTSSMIIWTDWSQYFCTETCGLNTQNPIPPISCLNCATCNLPKVPSCKIGPNTNYKDRA